MKTFLPKGEPMKESLWRLVFFGEEVRELLLRNEELESENAKLRAENAELYALMQEGEKARAKVMWDLVTRKLS